MLTQQRNEYKYESIIDFILYRERLRELVRNEKVMKSPEKDIWFCQEWILGEK